MDRFGAFRSSRLLDLAVAAAAAARSRQAAPAEPDPRVTASSFPDPTAAQGMELAGYSPNSIGVATRDAAPMGTRVAITPQNAHLFLPRPATPVAPMPGHYGRPPAPPPVQVSPTGGVFPRPAAPVVAAPSAPAGSTTDPRVAAAVAEMPAVGMVDPALTGTRSSPPPAPASVPPPSLPPTPVPDPRVTASSFPDPGAATLMGARGDSPVLAEAAPMGSRRTHQPPLPGTVPGRGEGPATPPDQTAVQAEWRPRVEHDRDVKREEWEDAARDNRIVVARSHGNLAVAIDDVRAEMTENMGRPPTDEELSAVLALMAAAPKPTSEDLTAAQQREDQAAGAYALSDATVVMLGGDTEPLEEGGLLGRAAGWLFWAMDQPRQAAATGIGEAGYRIATGGDAGEAAGAVAQAADVIGVPGADLADPFVAWVQANPDRVKDVYENGYDANGDGTPDYTGGRAVWEAFIGTQPTVMRAVYDVVIDPLNYLGLLAGAGRGLARAGVRIAAGDSIPVSRRAAGEVVRLLGRAAQAPQAVLDEPVDRAVGAAIRGIWGPIGETRGGQRVADLARNIFAPNAAEQIRASAEDLRAGTVNYAGRNAGPAAGGRPRGPQAPDGGVPPDPAAPGPENVPPPPQSTIDAAPPVSTATTAPAPAAAPPRGAGTRQIGMADESGPLVEAAQAAARGRQERTLGGNPVDETTPRYEGAPRRWMITGPDGRRVYVEQNLDGSYTTREPGPRGPTRHRDHPTLDEAFADADARLGAPPAVEAPEPTVPAAAREEPPPPDLDLPPSPESPGPPPVPGSPGGGAGALPPVERTTMRGAGTRMRRPRNWPVSPETDRYLPIDNGDRYVDDLYRADPDATRRVFERMGGVNREQFALMRAANHVERPLVAGEFEYAIRGYAAEEPTLRDVPVRFVRREANPVQFPDRVVEPDPMAVDMENLVHDPWNDPAQVAIRARFFAGTNPVLQSEPPRPIASRTMGAQQAAHDRWNRLLNVHRALYPNDPINTAAERAVLARGQQALPDPATAPQEPTPPATTTFTTSRGSTYAVEPGGGTTRDKAARADVGHEGDSGPKPTSETTVYVTEDARRALDEVTVRGGPRADLALTGDGRIGVRYREGPSAGRFERRTVVPYETEPAVGLHPVELWEGGRRHHFGNPIVSVEPSAQAVAPSAPTPDLAASPTTTTPKGRPIRRVGGDYLVNEGQFPTVVVRNVPSDPRGRVWHILDPNAPGPPLTTVENEQRAFETADRFLDRPQIFEGAPGPGAAPTDVADEAAGAAAAPTDQSPPSTPGLADPPTRTPGGLPIVRDDAFPPGLYTARPDIRPQRGYRVGTDLRMVEELMPNGSVSWALYNYDAGRTELFQTLLPHARSDAMSEVMAVADARVSAKASVPWARRRPEADPAEPPRTVATPSGPQAVLPGAEDAMRPVFGGQTRAEPLPTTPATLSLEAQVLDDPAARREAERLAGQQDLFGVEAAPEPGPSPESPPAHQAQAIREATDAGDAQRTLARTVATPPVRTAPFEDAVRESPFAQQRQVPFDRITTTRERGEVADFQNRAADFSEESARNVVASYRRDPDAFADNFDPILVRANDDGTYTVMSGHSRREGVRRLIEAGDLPPDTPIPVRLSRSTGERAATTAQLSNLRATGNTPAETGRVLRRLMDDADGTLSDAIGVLKAQHNISISTARARQAVDISYLPNDLADLAVDRGADTVLPPAKAEVLGAAVRKGEIDPAEAQSIYYNVVATRPDMGLQKLRDYVSGVAEKKGRGPQGGLPGQTLMFDLPEAQQAVDDFIELGQLVRKNKAKLTTAERLARDVENPNVSQEERDLASAAERAAGPIRRRIEEIEARLSRVNFARLPEQSAAGPARATRRGIGAAYRATLGRQVRGIEPDARSAAARFFGEGQGAQRLLDRGDEVHLSPEDEVIVADEARLFRPVFETGESFWDRTMWRATQRGGDEWATMADADRFAVIRQAAQETANEYVQQMTRRASTAGAERAAARPRAVRAATAVGKAMLRAFLAFWDPLTNFARDTLLYNVAVSGKRLATNVAGNASAAALLWRDPELAARFLGLGTRGIDFEDTLVRLGWTEFGSKARLRETTDAMRASGEKLAPEGFLTDSWFAKTFRVPDRPAKMVAGVFANPYLAKAVTLQDRGSRRVLAAMRLVKYLPQARADYREALATYLTRNGLAEHAGAVDEAVAGLGTAFRPADARAAVQDVLRARGVVPGKVNDAGIRAERDWIQANEDLRNRVGRDVERFFFTQPKTNADAALSRVILFNFWLSRASASYAREAVRHPGTLNALVKWQQEEGERADRMDLPPWLRGFYKVVAGDDGLLLWFNPTALLSTYLFFRDQAGEVDDPNWYTKLTSAGMMLAPALQFLVNAAGYDPARGDFATPPDPLGLGALRQAARTIVNVGRAVGIGGDTPVTHDVLDTAYRRARSVLSGILPGSEHVEFVPAGATEHARFVGYVMDAASDAGMSQDEIAAAMALPADDPNSLFNPDNPIYQEGLDRYAVAEGIYTTARGLLPVQVQRQQADTEQARAVARGDQAVAGPGMTRTTGDGRTEPVPEGTALPPIPEGFDPWDGTPVTQEEMAFLRAYKAATGIWLGPDELAAVRRAEQTATEQRDAMNAGSEAARVVQAEDRDFDALGTPRQDYAARRWSQIAFGPEAYDDQGNPVPGTGGLVGRIVANGETWTEADFTAYRNEMIELTGDEAAADEAVQQLRYDLADAWAEEQGYAEDRAALRTAQEGFAEAHPRFADYQAFQDEARDHPGDVIGWWEEEAGRNPSAAAFLEEALADGLTGGQLERRLTSTDAYLAVLGQRETIFDPESPPTDNPESPTFATRSGGTPPPVAAATPSNRGGGGGGGGGTSLHDQAADVAADLAEYEAAVRAQDAALGGSPYPANNPWLATVADARLARAGIAEPPRLSGLAREYVEWRAAQPRGANVSIMAFLVERQRANAEGRTASLPPSRQAPSEASFQSVFYPAVAGQPTGGGFEEFAMRRYGGGNPTVPSFRGSGTRLT